MSKVCLNFEITDSSSDEKLRTAIATDFFMSNYFMYIEEAIKEEKSDLELAETVENTARLAFAVADMFMANKNRVTGTEKGEEYDYV
jgi:hypothetical protein